MSVTINIGKQNVRITAQPLSQEAFAPFGDVIANPRPSIHPSSFDSLAGSLPPNAESANQGSAVKYSNVSRIKNLYGQAPSKKGEPAMSMFVCAARELNSAGAGSQGEFTVRVLERHPYTTQTFTPIASSASTYLVIVAPSLPPGSQDADLPTPSGSDLPGRGLPDLHGLRAFVATSKQAVTYGAGTWHAPMVVLGDAGTALDFVVSQFTSGVGVEDCQLANFESEGSADARIQVRVPQTGRVEKL